MKLAFSMRAEPLTCSLPSRSCLAARSDTRRLLPSTTWHRAGAARSRGKLQVVAFKVGERQWWTEHQAPNVQHITSAKEFVAKLEEAGDNLVVVDFYAKWCVACRAMFPELVKLARKNPDLVVLCVCYDENKELCQALQVKNIPFFHMYRSKQLVAKFSCGVSKLWILKDAIAKFRPLPQL